MLAQAANLPYRARGYNFAAVTGLPKKLAIAKKLQSIVGMTTVRSSWVCPLMGTSP
jgi:hypothetical protein